MFENRGDPPPFQQDFVKNVKHHFKQEGEAWLERLPEIIKQCEQIWQLEMKEPYVLSINYVAPAVRIDGRKLVVKLSIPGEDFAYELEALRHLESPAIVQLIDFDEKLGALLLERIEPGVTLAEVEEEDKACRIAADVFEQLIREPLGETALPTTEDREASLAKIIADYPKGCGPISQSVLLEAQRTFHRLHSTRKKQWVLHGDFHHYNVLQSGEKEWKAIDPKGLIGEREYDLVQYLLNKLPEENPVSVIDQRIKIFTDILKLDKQRLVLWGFCHSVLATCWTVEEDGNYHRPFFQTIAAFRQIHQNNYRRDIDEAKIR
ncbi:aminoglycoside phosphotransferase family protein [Sediminibacillus halophilus]|uniref:Streptomycin 6-kinase n=1 Tax=Sediminibacillus halophilus TaxID=482461 RepID=A0A1G9P063_9BACI|nr:aminoglycoside phosphotransferase family protein [Sediminibacillus halophilus]SDL92198.1 streptomycin 6-kinase [Sediminibacillus halophilus]